MMRIDALKVMGLTLLAMLAFAGNSLLCRLALKQSHIDASSFTAVRLVSGAITLLCLSHLRQTPVSGRRGDWVSALALLAYAAFFSFAYVGLPAGPGALLLFGAVQITMIGFGLWRGERLTRWQWTGFVAAFVGLGALLLPGAQAPAWSRATLMLLSGVAWGVYSLRGRGASDPLGATAGNFWRAAALCVLASAPFVATATVDWPGALYAIASGAITSGVGYAIWYAALRHLTTAAAASVQLSVPVLAAVGAVVWLGEPLTLRLAAASVVILGGVAMVIRGRRRPPSLHSSRR